ncbi:MAG: VWA domain-containing protein [Flavobacteriales bacterium]|nr:VWA domain-containing protein [Flavobacteriales bacterium]
MELDEILYSKIVKLLQKRKKKKEDSNPHIVYLSDIQPRLLFIARALTGSPIEIYPAEREGGYKNDDFFLPEKINLFSSVDQNVQFYFFRIFFLSIQYQLQLNLMKPTENEEITEKQTEQNAKPILEKMETDFPNVYSIYQGLLNQFILQNQSQTPELFWFYGKWMYNSPNTIKNPKTNHEKNNPLAQALSEEIKTIIKSKPVEEIKAIEIDKKAQEDYVLNHNFEKVETADEFSGSWRDFDGEDDLEDHADAINELSMRYVVRTDEQNKSIYQSDFRENVSIAEGDNTQSNETVLSYPEWDYKSKEYKPDFCKIYISKLMGADQSFYAKTLSEQQKTLTGLRKMLAAVNNKRRLQRRLQDGSQFDTDAVTDYFVDTFGKKDPSDKIYVSDRKKEKSLSIALLIDMSMSADSYADNNRIIDVERQVSILFGEILHEQSVDFAVYGFNSKTHNHSNFIIVKDFDDPWKKSVANFSYLEPTGYTRIGAAIRHCNQLLQARENQKKWMILLSDGKPNDFDRYEGKYGIEDIRKALHELNFNHIQHYALAIEANAKFYLPQMFGVNHFQILSSANQLVNAMVRLYEKIRV